MLRTPLLKLAVLDEIMDASSVEELLRTYYAKDMIREALFLASPQLYRKTNTWLKQTRSDPKLELSLLKYLIRMSSRSTPFGLFAGIASGSFGEQVKVAIAKPDQHRLKIRYDFQIICNILDQFSKKPNTREAATFYINSSLYSIGDEYRYIEFDTDHDGVRHYKLQRTVSTPELESVLHVASCSALLHELSGKLINEGIDQSDANEYIQTLIGNQVLISGNEPGVNGNSSMGIPQNSREAFEGYGKNLLPVQNSLNKADFLQHADRIKMYEEVISTLQSEEFPLEENAVFQADLKLHMDSCVLDSCQKDNILDVMPLLMKLSRVSKNPLLERFKGKFIQRYEEREIPLLIAMDDEAGPGYNSEEYMPGDADLLKDLRVTRRPEQPRNLSFTPVDIYLYRRLSDALIQGEYAIELTHDEIDHLQMPEHAFPNTIAIMTKILGSNNDKQSLQILSAGGTSGLNLAGRFCYMDAGLEKAMNHLAHKEQEMAGDNIIAEILHLPQQRTGNILFRPAFYDYEIPFLAHSCKKPEYRIPLSDLMVSVRNNKVLLRSKRLDRYIVPRLSNAHNYAAGSLSVYHFLCDLQSQQSCTSFGFHWGPLEQETTFLPRLMFKNIILSPATWNLQKTQFEFLIKANGEDRLTAVNKLRDIYKLPREILICEADNELWIDLGSPNCMELLQHEFKGKERVQIKEFFRESIVDGQNGKMANEVVFFLYKDK